ncbi:putative class-II glutamine amidotransferase [Neisseria animaloris]|uniref:Putative class-II glutamine amidotransferase n=1 Tax=Neisseria animaloris TaxID=326522 RepID=A0A1X3CHG9_9NEIS|nr:class II glutamine amidotransferase [Neisseria animaloris]OSI06954.1 class II glutamine amidotransferase [Neisseria animaloris]VEH88071.1 putative class-II glutamine amidotransferase [Neisseria animaloris]VEJ21894.1 putative class-II glutamine amidotransferase [Neisseria animaloris]
MCQLLGMNCNTPTDIVFSFEGFRRRGGLTDNHADGFGIGFFEGKGVRLFHDDRPSAGSPVADLVKAYQIKSENVIAHIRKATQGQTSLANTHPFMREMWGEYWLFAHNGHLKNFHPETGGFYRPVGNTDSERAFCYILEQLRQRFSERPDTDTLFDAVTALTDEIRSYGLFNFMMSNGEYLFAHASTLLYYIVRKAPFGEAHLLDDDVTVDFAAVTTPNDKVAVIATLPLTGNETWSQLAVNELILFQDGDIIRSDTPENPVYMSVEEGLDIARAAGVSV